MKTIADEEMKAMEGLMKKSDTPIKMNGNPPGNKPGTIVTAGPGITMMTQTVNRNTIVFNNAAVTTQTKLKRRNHPVQRFYSQYQKKRLEEVYN